MAEKFYEIIEPQLEIHQSDPASSPELIFGLLLGGLISLILLAYWLKKHRNSPISVLKRFQKLSKSINQALTSGQRVKPSHKSKLIKLNHLLRSYINSREVAYLDSEDLGSIVLSEIETLILKVEAQ